MLCWYTVSADKTRPQALRVYVKRDTHSEPTRNPLEPTRNLPEPLEPTRNHSDSPEPAENKKNQIKTRVCCPTLSGFQLSGFHFKISRFAYINFGLGTLRYG